MFDQLERDFMKVTLAAISAVTVANMLVNWRGTVAIAETATAFPVKLIDALRTR